MLACLSFPTDFAVAKIWCYASPVHTAWPAERVAAAPAAPACVAGAATTFGGARFLDAVHHIWKTWFIVIGCTRLAQIIYCRNRGECIGLGVISNEAVVDGFGAAHACEAIILCEVASVLGFHILEGTGKRLVATLRPCIDGIAMHAVVQHTLLQGTGDFQLGHVAPRCGFDLPKCTPLPDWGEDGFVVQAPIQRLFATKILALVPYTHSWWPLVKVRLFRAVGLACGKAAVTSIELAILGVVIVRQVTSAIALPIENAAAGVCEASRNYEIEVESMGRRRQSTKVFGGREVIHSDVIQIHTKAAVTKKL